MCTGLQPPEVTIFCIRLWMCALTGPMPGCWARPRSPQALFLSKPHPGARCKRHGHTPGGHGEQGSQTNLNWTYDSLQITIDLGREYTKDEQYTVYIDYTARPEDRPEGGSFAITSDKGLYFINRDGSVADKPQQIWTQGETEASSVWFPTIDKPNERTTDEIYITVDKNSPPCPMDCLQILI